MWPALAILAGSALLNYQNERQAQKRRQSLANAMQAFQRQRSQEAMAATEALVKEQTPEARGAELASLTRDREQSMRDSVGAAQSFDAPAIVGKMSADYAGAQEREAATRAEKLRRAIEQLATMGAPGEQQLKHGLRHGRAAGVVDASNAAMERIGSAYASDIDSVRPDPFLAFVSDAGRMVGTGMTRRDARIQRQLNSAFSLWGLE